MYNKITVVRDGQTNVFLPKNGYHGFTRQRAVKIYNIQEEDIMKKTLKKVLCLALAVVMVFSLAACGGKENETAKEYTYNTALADFPTNWSPFQNQTATDSEIMDYITYPFYVLDYNETKD